MTAKLSRQHFNRALMQTLVVPLLLIAVCPFVYLWFGHRLLQAMQASRRSVEVVASAYETEKLLVDQEAGVRGYQLSGDELLLEPFHKANPRIDPEFDKLEKLVADNPAQLQQLGLIRHDRAAWNEFAQEAISRIRAKSATVAFNESGKRLMDQVRADVATFIAVERAIRDQRNAGIASMRESTLVWTFAAFLGAVIGTAWWVGRQLTVVRQSYADALEESESQKESFRVTLASIGDAVIVTDKNGYVTFINQEAERLTGWRMDEAVGHALKTIFRIVNEESREPVDDPVEKVHREHRVVGLANHTALLARNGNEWLIEDSAAPIFGADRQISGVVLIFQDATERRRAQKALARARDEALAASQAKDKFIAALSHELRTPLNPVLLVASEAAANPGLPEAVRQDFETIVKNVAIEARLIDDLLDMTSITRGKMSMDLKVLDIAQPLGDALEKVQADITGKLQVLTSNIGTGRHLVQGDAARLQQVFWNVLRNASKFTPNGGTIDIEVKPAPGGREIVISVRDSGIGMTASEIGRAFDFFEQGDHVKGAGRHRFGGLGLGLAISRMLVEAHQGSIAAESDGPDRGCTIRITVPRYAGDRVEASGSPSHSRPGRGNGKTRTILVVEDHQATREVLRRLLEARNNAVLAAGSVAEALEAAQNHRVDLLISDLGLPDGDGFELMARLRERFNIRGLALSGYGMAADLARGQDAGFVAHLVKPVTAQALDEALAAFFRGSGI